ncbi:MAG: RDD family protein [Methanosarcinales archaeon]|nr:RDD family protein [ANME-2 cluster archaeon]MDF1530838.1 RDD family protein [ANME-2 cluster archaeon]MDW7776495.1 RDD family protein [Methanosarcinales archaeon]
MNEEMNEKAGFFQRLIAYLIDSVLLTIVIGIVGAIALVGNLAMMNNQTLVMAITFISLVLMMTIYFGYFIYFFGTSGQTIGKKMLNIKVVSTDGSPLTYKKGLLRVIGYMIASIPIYIGLIWMLFDKDKQNWEDKIANTYVVKV